MRSLVSGKVLKEVRKGRWELQSVSGSKCYRCEVLKVLETEEGTSVKVSEGKVGRGTAPVTFQD
jgi:hypothetical protein